MPDRAEAAMTPDIARAGATDHPPRRSGRRRFDLPAFMKPSRTIPELPLGLQTLWAQAAGETDFSLRFIRGYTLYDQGSTLWCWAAMGESIAGYYNPGSQWTQCRLANRLRRPGQPPTDCCAGGGSQCNEMRTMDDVFDAIGHLRDPRVGPIEFEDICEEVERGRPICVRVTPGGNGHFVAITGVERVGGVDMILVNDPRRQDGMVPYARFCVYYLGSSSWTHTYLTRREGGVEWA